MNQTNQINYQPIHMMVPCDVYKLVQKKSINMKRRRSHVLSLMIILGNQKLKELEAIIE